MFKPAYVLATLMMACALQTTTSAHAQAPAYPTRPITLVVPFAAGGSVDIVGRMAAEHLRRTLKQTVVVENKVGAGGIIGSNYVAKAAPDGYTLLLGIASTHAMLPAYKTDLPYDTVNDFAPISQFASGGIAIAVRSDSPYRSMADLIAAAKADPKTPITYGTGGNGSGGHLAAEAVAVMTGITMTHVPYKGGSQAITDVVSGHISVVYTDTTTLKSMNSTGRLRVLATVGEKRNRAFPDVLTLAEQGIPLATGSWMALFAPARTPPAIIERIRADLTDFVFSGASAEKLDEMGLTPNRGTPAALHDLQLRDIAIWKRVITQAGLQLQ
jgi:tripartite-type tricarboxylate transporter receptor subunit TctC